MRKKLDWAARVGVSAFFAVLTACGGGGGGGGAIGSSSGGSGQTFFNVDPAAAAYITSQQAIAGSPGAFPVASGSTPNFSNGPPPDGTVFPMEQSGFIIELSAHGETEGTQNSGVSVTFAGTVNGSSTYELKIPDYSLDATGLTNGGTANLSDGRVVTFGITGLDYSLYSVWGVSPALTVSSATYLGIGVSGYQTPTSGIPAGSGSYSSNDVSGIVLVSSGTGGVSVAEIDGSVLLNVNFSSGAINGSLTGMTATPSGGSASPWNDVTISGTLSGAVVSGTTATPAAASGMFGLAATSTGTIRGSLFGPNGEELGAVWTLNDSTSDGHGNNGKAALGLLGATKQ
jgi:hypothetical protein